MKIYGKTFGEVYNILPWTYKTVIVVGFAFIAFVVIHTISLLFIGDPQKVPAAFIFPGEDNNASFYDPAIAADPVMGRVWMAFSSIQPVVHAEAAVAPAVRLAFSEAPCKLWQLLPPSAGLRASNDSVVAPDGETTIAAGVWRYETPAVVFDPDDPGQEWKFYAYKYLWTADQNFQAARRYSVIVYSSAAKPELGLSAEKWMFSAKADYPPAPYADLVAVKLDSLDPSLADVTMYTRPSALYVNGVILMSLSAFTDKQAPDRVIMISSSDHGKTWQYMGTPLTAADAARVGSYTHLGGATLLRQGERIYLSAVFGDAQVAGMGTYVFSFDDIMHGSLKRDEKTGAPVTVQYMPRHSLQPTDVGGGYAAYTDACPFGMLTGEHSGVRKMFKLFKTYRKPDGQLVQ
jgi:hypothetical protein